MPYIKAADYDRAAVEPATPGELNYAITLHAIKVLMDPKRPLTLFHTAVWPLVQGYCERKEMSYEHGNAVMGVLDCATREVYRRTNHAYNAKDLNAKLYPQYQIGLMLARMRLSIYNTMIAPYEDEKILENGDVFPDVLTNG
jgi:hypothetical protein